jgi:hypothetical protein
VARLAKRVEHLQATVTASVDLADAIDELGGRAELLAGQLHPDDAGSSTSGPVPAAQRSRRRHWMSSNRRC